jgi:leader peptidase (prepilin peptidase) / N-methyltransferase
MNEVRASDLSAPLRIATAVVGLTLGAAAISTFGLNPDGLICGAMCVVLTAVAVFDIEHRVIPNRIVVPAIAMVLVARVAFFPDHAWVWPLAGLGAGLILYLPGLVHRGAIGMGDVKLAILLGVALGSAVTTALLIASLSLAPVAAWMLITRGASARQETLPFGPFLAVGGILAIFLS